MPLHVPTSVNQVTGPGYITTPGIYYLQNDILADPSGTSIQITSGNVVFDGMGHTIQGLGSGGTTGILVTKANVTVRNVTVTDWYYGISYQNTQYGTIDGVNASSNAFGSYLHSTNDMTLTNSRVTGNSQSGISFDNTNGNTVYNNYFNNVNNVNYYYTPSGDIWNTTLTPGTNIVGGSWLGGNYWAQPDGTGFSQSHGDSDNNGICDDVYSLPGGSDQLPLHVPTSVNQVTGPATISSPGRYVLQNDVVNDPYQSSWNGILITSSDVWLDGMGHTIDGMDSPLNMSVRGVYADTGSALSNITVTNLTVRNCWQGVDYYLVQDGLIDHVVSRDNPYIGIGLLYSKNITIANWCCHQQQRYWYIHSLQRR